MDNSLASSQSWKQPSESWTFLEGVSWRGYPLTHFAKKIHLLLHIEYVTKWLFSARSICPMMSSTPQNGPECLKQRCLKGMGRVGGTVLIKFPSPSYFPTVLKPKHGLISFFLLLICLLSGVLLRENPDSVETRSVVGLISSSTG